MKILIQSYFKMNNSERYDLQLPHANTLVTNAELSLEDKVIQEIDDMIHLSVIQNREKGITLVKHECPLDNDPFGIEVHNRIQKLLRAKGYMPYSASTDKIIFVITWENDDFAKKLQAYGSLFNNCSDSVHKVLIDKSLTTYIFSATSDYINKVKQCQIDNVPECFVRWISQELPASNSSLYCYSHGNGVIIMAHK